MLGRGGMGAVYRAFDPLLARDVAIKVVHRELWNEAPAALRREAQALARIAHPNICQIFDVGDTPQGGIFIAMQFIEGRSLSDMIRGMGVVPIARVAQIVRQIAEAMEFAHTKGVIHRDLKPSNIIIEERAILSFWISDLRDLPMRRTTRRPERE